MAAVGSTPTPSVDATGKPSSTPPIPKQGDLATGQKVVDLKDVSSGKSPAKDIAEDVESYVGEFFAMVESTTTQVEIPARTVVNTVELPTMKELTQDIRASTKNIFAASDRPLMNLLNCETKAEMHALVAQLLGGDFEKLTLANLLISDFQGPSRPLENKEQLQKATADAKNTTLFFAEAKDSPANIIIHRAQLDQWDTADAYVQNFSAANNVTFERAPNLIVVGGTEEEWNEFVGEVKDQISVNLDRAQMLSSEVQEGKVSEGSHRAPEGKVGREPEISGRESREEKRTPSALLPEAQFRESEDKAIGKMTEQWQKAEREKAKEAAQEAKKIRREGMERDAQEKRLDR